MTLRGEMEIKVWILHVFHCNKDTIIDSMQTSFRTTEIQNEGEQVGYLILFVLFTSFFVFCIADLPHSPGVVYYHLLLRQETRIAGVACMLLFSNRNLGSFCA